MFLLARSVDAQVTLAAIRGKVTDEQAAVIPGATITARHVATNTMKVGVTSELGQYYLSNLPAGEYEVSVELVGFGSERRTGIVLQVGQEVGLDFKMTLGGVAETVTVVSESTLVETTRSAVATVVKKEQIDELPVVERDFSSLALMAPGVTTGTGGYGAGGTGESLSFNGQRAFTSGVFIDGASAMWQFYGKQAKTFPQDWVQEFQVLTNSFGAEFGTASGGVLNVISRSGSNTLTGRAYGFFRDSSLDSPPFAGRFVDGEATYLDEAAPLSQQRWGGFLGGPVIKNRVFFFVGNENLSTKGTDILGISDYWRQRGEQTVIDTSTTDHPFIVKTDINLGTNHRASLRYDRSITMQTNQGGPLQVQSARQTFGGPVWTVVGGFTSTLANAAFNELRASFLSNKPPIICNQAGAGGSALLALGPAGMFARRNFPGATFGCGFSGLEAEEDLFIGDTLSFLYGRHQVKVGVTAAQVRTIIDSLNVRNGAWTFNRDLAFDINNPSSYPDRWSGGTSIPNYSKAVWGLNAFAQDSWNIRDDLTLNIGVRYDIDAANTIVNGFIDTKNDQIVSKLGGQPFFERQKAQHNVSPRIGVVWRPLDRMTFRGAAGVFYDMSHNNYAIFSINNSLLAERTASLIATNSLNNPFWKPSDPAGSARELRAYLAQNFPYWPDLSLVPAAKERLVTVNDMGVPFTRQYTGGVSYQFPFALTVDADVVISQGVDGIVARDDNVGLVNGVYITRDPRFGVINAYHNDGWTRYKALQTQARYQRGNARVGVSYTLAESTSNYATGIKGGAATNALDLSEDEGPDDSDRRHNLVINGSYSLPFDIQASGIYAYRSGMPYSVSTSKQLDSDPFTDRPEPRNSRRGAALNNLDLRVSKIVRLPKNTKVTAFWELFNAFNKTNFTQYQGSLEAANFGLPIEAAPMRRQQFGIRIDF
ncbi:MAG: TonB-dependent receptor [Vicinamibacterales bacterium]|nr:TonB-dependent receptor [Vicinamibacterales bacterium]